MKTIVDKPSRIFTPKDLGRAIRARRKELGMRQSDVAMQVGISLPTMSAIENGKETAQVGIVLQVARDIGLELFTGDV